MKKWMLLLLCGCMLLTLPGCGTLGVLGNHDNGEVSGTQKENQAIKQDGTTSFTNTYLGVTCTLPADWWLYYVDESNFDIDPDQTRETGQLDILTGYGNGNGDSTILLLEAGNLQFSDQPNHLSIDLSAQKLKGIEYFGEYMDFYIDQTLAPFGDQETYYMKNPETITIGDVAYEKFIFEAHREDELFYVFVTFTCEVNDGYYLSIVSSYWPENATAVEDTIAFIEKAIDIG